MGPTNKALLDLFRADTALRQAQANLDAATRGVRVQRKRAELAAAAQTETHNRLKHAKAQQMELNSDLKARDARIEHLRQQQQAAQNHKQYQIFLVEINTQKADRGKVEEQAVAKLAEVEELQKLEAHHRDTAAAEKLRADKLESEINATTTELRQEIERLGPMRDEAAGRVPGAALALFEKLADNYDGEALSAVGHIEGRTETYYCTACNMELVVDVYNRLMTRDEVLNCPGCRRLLYVPEDLTPDKAVRQKKPAKAPRKKAVSGQAKPRKRSANAQRSESEQNADVHRIVTTAAAEALRQAELSGGVAVDAQVYVSGQPAGIFRVGDVETLRRLVAAKMQAEAIEASVAVTLLGGQPASPAHVPGDEPAAEAPPAGAEAGFPAEHSRAGAEAPAST